MEQNIICYKCKELKPITEFTKDKTSPRGYYGYCKKCKYAKAKERKAWLNPKYRQKTLEYRRKQKLLAIEYKGEKCVDCGYDKHPSAFDFHHLSEKTDTPSNLLKGGFEKAKKELDDCILLCKNCHSIRHFLDGGMNKNGFNQHNKRRG